MSEHAAQTGASGGRPQDLTPTPGQTVGPFFGFALPFADGQHLVPPGSPGSVRLHGTVYDGQGQPIPDAMLELWQADASGALPTAHGSLIRDGHTFTGWGRTGTDNVGGYSFTTVEPGVVQEGSARFFSVVVFALPDEIMGEAVTAAVQPEDGPSEELRQRLLTSCNAHLPSYKVPRHLFFVDEFPLNSSNKVDRTRLQEIAAVGLRRP